MRALPLALAAVLAALAAGCGVEASPPARAPRDARGGHAPSGFTREIACGTWEAATHADPVASVHDSFPELDAASCFVPVRYGAGPTPAVAVDPTPPGCGYPGQDTRARLAAMAARYERVASGHLEDVPRVLACNLPPAVRAAAATANARTLRALAGRPDSARSFPYAAVAAFGHGREDQGPSAYARHTPGDACMPFDVERAGIFGANLPRAARAAAAYRAGVAPVVVLSGGAPHSTAVEAFLLDYLAVCRFGVPADAVLLDPCADHTHTNLRNTGRLLVEIGGRTAYVVTDDGWQSDYLFEWTLFSLVGGSIDDRSLRDFGYLLGAWRRASVGARWGFWYSPYRFWADPRPGLGDLTCVE